MVIEERIVGPSLGEDSIIKGFNSVLIGILRCCSIHDILLQQGVE